MPEESSIEDALERGVVDADSVSKTRETLTRLALWMRHGESAVVGSDRSISTSESMRAWLEPAPPVLRRNLWDLDAPTTEQLKSVLLSLNDESNPIWGRFVFLHHVLTPLVRAQEGLRFLPWHRLFLAEFERAMLAQPDGNGLFLPYWTFWQTESIGRDGRARSGIPPAWRSFTPTIHMPVLAKDRGLERLIEALRSEQVLEAMSSVDAAFTGTQWHQLLQARGRGGVIRVIRDDNARLDQAILGLPNRDQVRNALAQQDFAGWPDQRSIGLSTALEQIHSAVAAWVGGTHADARTRAADPLFFFQAVELDRLWALWQREHRAPAPSTTGAELPPWSTTINAVMDVGGAAIRVDYANSPEDDPTGDAGEDSSVVDVPFAPEAVLDELEANAAEAVTYVYKIHPAIGVARVGDSPDEWFVGPETPGRSVKPVSDQFRDRNHKIKRQAARFRIWEYEQNAAGKLTPKREITTAQAKITWTVNLANKKASFYKFEYLAGERQSPGKPLSGYAAGHPLRNAGVGSGGVVAPNAERMRKLWIDPGAVSLVAAESAHTIIEDTKTEAAIKHLGVLRTDRQGRLYVYGGKGQAKPKSPAAPLPDTFNNDDWFDDVSDGPVSAEVVFLDGRKVTVGGWTHAALDRGTPGPDAGGAWVIVGPPDFAPQIANLVTLFDLLYDVTRAHLSLPNSSIYDIPAAGSGSPGQLWRLKGLKASLASYVPSFTHEIYPILVRVLEQRWVDKVLQAMFGRGGFHGTSDPNRLWAELATKSSSLRGGIFARLRPPTGTPSASQTMPKLWGDDYNVGGQLHLTVTQYSILERWKDGFFVEDWPGSPPPEPADSVTPDGLDRAALEAGVGGALAVGIETSWLIRDPQNFAEPFRIKHHVDIQPGHFTAQMAIPWHTDFLACTRTNGIGWWPAIRPDEVFVKGSTTMQPWARNAAGTSPSRQDFATKSWAEMGFVVDVKGDRSRFEERERK